MIYPNIVAIAPQAINVAIQQAAIICTLRSNDVRPIGAGAEPLVPARGSICQVPLPRPGVIFVSNMTG